jgi:protein O-GlcNAc transferase
MTGTAADAALDEAVRIHRAGDLAQAERIYRRVLDDEPGNARALHNLATIRVARGQLGAARRLLEQALAQAPDWAMPHMTHAGVCLALEDEEAATAAYARAVELDDSLVGAWADLATLHFDAGRHDQALDCSRRALALSPEDPGQLHNLGAVLIKLWHVDEAMDLFRRAAARPDATSRVLSMVLYRLHFARDARQSEILALARRCGRQWMPAGEPPEAPRADPDPARRLRIGYVSGDFREHALAHFIEPLLIHHDRAAFEVHCFDTSPASDRVTERFRGRADAWHAIREMSDEAAAALVRKSGIDILLDLSGHTDHHRLGLFARRPAALQITWMGFMNTTGLPAMDRIVANDTLIPEEEASLYVERPLRLSDSHLCFDPLMPPLPVGAPPALDRGQVTFGCFNRLDKVNPAVVACWARILRAVPDARLMLKTPELDLPPVHRRVSEAFAQAGVDPSRLLLEGGAPREAYCRAMSRMDIALDPFPHNGGTVTCQTLWMGVPVLTLEGREGMIARYGASFLRAVGLGEWIAGDEDDYVRRAVAHARDLPALARIRGDLRDRLLASPAGNGGLFVAQLEEALRRAWRERCASPSPRP